MHSLGIKDDLGIVSVFFKPFFFQKKKKKKKKRGRISLQTVFFSSPHLRFIMGIFLDWAVPRVDSLMGEETFMRTKCFEPVKRVDAPSSLLLTVPRR